MGVENYLAIDVGATKTLFAVIDPSGAVVFEHKIPTNQVYDQFLKDVRNTLNTDLAKYKFKTVCCAVPGWLDFKHGIAVAFGVLPWRNIRIKDDLQEIFYDLPLLYHNDAKLAGLSEAILLHGKYKKVLYLTISTGIGGAVIIDDIIDPNFYNFEPGQMVFDYNGKSTQWEDIASGRALKERYGKLASEIEDQAIWKEFTQPLAMGLQELLAVIGPDAVIFGGGLGAHFEKFKDFLAADLQAYSNPMVPIPPLLKAQRPEEAVVYGCYEYIKQNAEIYG